MSEEDKEVQDNTTKTKEKKPRTAVGTISTIVMLAICVALAATVIVNMLSEKDNGLHAANANAEVESSVNVSVIETSYGPFTNLTTFNGEIESDGQEVSIYPDAGGTLTEVLVKKGDQVKKGDIIAYVDPSVPGSSYKVSPVKATITGQVESVPVVNGMKVTSSTAIATIMETDTPLKITTQLSERYLGTIQVGTEATFTSVAYPDKTFTAVITYISSTVSTSTRTATVELDITGDTTGLKPGMYVRISLATEYIESAMVVPTSAVSTYINDKVVFVVTNESRATRRVVTTGTSNASQTVITSGLEEGETVVIAGSVGEGVLVNVL